MDVAVERDPSRAGPHPDLREALAAALDQTGREVAELAGPGPAQVADIRVLQQRTLFGLPWLVPSLRGAPSLTTVDVAVGLIVWTPPGGRRQLVQYQAYRQRRADTDTTPADWGIARTGQEWLDNASERPWSGSFDLARGLGICVGMLAHTPEIGGVRLTLADGQMFVSMLADGDNSTLLFAPFHSEDLWDGHVQLAVLDRQGQPLSMSDYLLPTPPIPPAS